MFNLRQSPEEGSPAFQPVNLTEGMHDAAVVEVGGCQACLHYFQGVDESLGCCAGQAAYDQPFPCGQKVD